MSIKIKYATKRHNTWVYRRTYPKHLQPLLGSSLKRSLKTADAQTAKTRVAELNQTFQSIIKESEQHVPQTLAKLLPSIPMPVVPLQVLDLVLSVLDISLFVFWVKGQ